MEKEAHIFIIMEIKTMKTVELFCGTKSFSKVAEELGHETFTIDNNSIFNPDLCIDILDFDIADLPFMPDFIWASPPCTTFSVASIGKHWNKDKTPKTVEALKGIEILNKTLEIINIINPKYWVIENPRGMMRNFMPVDNRTTVTYCQYGDKRMKPTDLWNNFNFIGKKCKNGSPCHVAAPRGSRTGTQGLKGSKERSVIPPKLFKEIFKQITDATTKKQ